MSEARGEQHSNPSALLHQANRLLMEASDALPGVQDLAALGSVVTTATNVAMAAHELARNATAHGRHIAETLRFEAKMEATVDSLFAVTSYFAWNTHRFSEAQLRAHLDGFFEFNSDSERMGDDDFSVLFGMVRAGIAEETGVEWVQSGFKDDTRDEIYWGITVPEGAELRALEGIVDEIAAPGLLDPEELRRREVAAVLGKLLVGGIKRTHLVDHLQQQGVEDPDAFLREAVAIGVAGTINRAGSKLYVPPEDAPRAAPAKPDAAGTKADQQPIDPAFTEDELEIASRVFGALARIPANERNDGIKMADLTARVGGIRWQRKRLSAGCTRVG